MRKTWLRSFLRLDTELTEVWDSIQDINRRLDSACLRIYELEEIVKAQATELNNLRNQMADQTVHLEATGKIRRASSFAEFAKAAEYNNAKARQGQA
jgi:septal ring factor EnvC (AmiA/AmiB activator)